TISATSSRWFATVIPSRKKVARAPSSSRRSSNVAVWRSSAGWDVSQSAKPSRRCTTWCQSSKSIESSSRGLSTPATVEERQGSDPSGVRPQQFGLRRPEARRVGRDDAAFSGFLGAVQRLVGTLEERHRVVFGAQLGDSRREVQLPGLSQGSRRDGVEDAPVELIGVLERRLREDHGELV